MIIKLNDKVAKITQNPPQDCHKYFSDLPLKLSAKDYFLQAGAVCTKMAFVVKGELRMFYITPEGKEINVEFFFEDDFAGAYQSFILQKKSDYFIQAITDCDLIIVPFNELQNAYTDSPYWQQFGRLIAERTYILSQQRTESLLFFDAETRYLNLLRKRPIVFEKIPLYHIASYLGIERESLSRLRNKLAKKTIVT